MKYLSFINDQFPSLEAINPGSLMLIREVIKLRGDSSLWADCRVLQGSACSTLCSIAAAAAPHVTVRKHKWRRLSSPADLSWSLQQSSHSPQSFSCTQLTIFYHHGVFVACNGLTQHGCSIPSGSQPHPPSPTLPPFSSINQSDGTARRGWRDKSRKMVRNMWRCLYRCSDIY